MAEKPRLKDEPDLPALVQRTLHGETDAAERLATLAHDEAYRHAVRALKNREDACDVVQDAMLKVFEGLPHLKHPALFPVWVVQIVRHEIGKHRRKARLRETWMRPMADVPDIELPLDPGLNPIEALIASDRRSIVHSTLDLLRPCDREILELYAYRNFSVSQIAEVLGVSRKTASKRLHAAGRRFKAAVGSEVGLYEKA